LKRQGKVKAISIDEAWTFEGKKENDIWIWSVIVEYFDGRIEKYLRVRNMRQISITFISICR